MNSKNKSQAEAYSLRGDGGVGGGSVFYHAIRMSIFHL